MSVSPCVCLSVCLSLCLSVSLSLSPSHSLFLSFFFLNSFPVFGCFWTHNKLGNHRYTKKRRMGRSEEKFQTYFFTLKNCDMDYICANTALTSSKSVYGAQMEWTAELHFEQTSLKLLGSGLCSIAWSFFGKFTRVQPLEMSDAPFWRNECTFTKWKRERNASYLEKYSYATNITYRLVFSVPKSIL